MIRQFIGSAGVVILCSCTADITIQEDFGNAVKHNVAVQTISPLRTQPDESDTLDGQKAAEAIDRYRRPPAALDGDSLIAE